MNKFQEFYQKNVLIQTLVLIFYWLNLKIHSNLALQPSVRNSEFGW